MKYDIMVYRRRRSVVWAVVQDILTDSATTQAFDFESKKRYRT